MLMKLTALTLFGFLLCGCATNRAAFISEPPGAAVFINGEQIGTTPCQYDYRNSAGQDYQVSVQKNGFEDLQQTVNTDEVDKGSRNTWLAAGLVWSPLWLGTFFTKKLKDSYEFILKQQPAEVAVQQSPEGQPTRF